MQLTYEICLIVCIRVNRSTVHILMYLLDIVLNCRYCHCIRYMVLLLSADVLNRIPSLSTSRCSVKKIVLFTIINPSNNNALGR
jgi:hypothetical protein